MTFLSKKMSLTRTCRGIIILRGVNIRLSFQLPLSQTNKKLWLSTTPGSKASKKDTQR